jgi:hypothetical protein
MTVIAPLLKRSKPGLKRLRQVPLKGRLLDANTKTQNHKQAGSARCVNTERRPNHIACWRQDNMANTQANRSIHKKQSAQRKKVIGNRLPATAGTAEKADGPRPTASQGRHTGVFDNRLSAKTKRPSQRPAIRSASNRKFVQFRETEGKTVQTVELLTAPDYHTISINFRDKTCLHFSIETGFTVKTDYSDWKTGEQRTIRKWRVIQSKPLAVGR